MTISNIVVNGNTYTDADWRADWEGTISAIANDIAAAIAGAAMVGGTLFKAISGNTTLTSGESLNRVYIFTGTLAAAANITFTGFEGLALVVNDTTGGFLLACGNGGAGSTAAVGGGNATLVYSDGTNFALTVGVVSTSTGAGIDGTLSVSGAATVGGAVSVAGALNVTGQTSVTGVMYMASDAHVAGGFEVSGLTAFHGNVNVDGNLIAGGSFSANTLLAASGCTVNGASRAFQVAATLGEIRGALSSPSGQSSWWQSETAGTAMWLHGKNNDAQSGSNTGANFDIVACSDAGTPVGIPFRIYRDTREVNLGLLPTSSAGLRAGSLWNNAGVVNVA